MARRVRKSRAGLERWNQLVSCLRLMNFAFNNVRLYPPTHTEVVGVVGKLHETLTPLLEEMEDIGFGFMDEMLYLEGAMTIEETASNQMLVDRFARCRVKYLILMKGLSKDDLLNFFKLMNAQAQKPSPEPPGDILSRNGIATIHVVEADVDDVASKSKFARRKTQLDWYQRAVAALAQAHKQLFAGQKADLKTLYRVADDMMATIRTKGYEPFLLLPIFGRGLDPHVAHSVNVAVLCCALGEMHGLNSGQIQTLCMAAFLHDLGRCIIPAEWAKDPARLSVFERAVVHQHSTWGFLLLTRNSEIPAQIGVLAAYHHSNPMRSQTGQGYKPDVFHKILNIADAYDLAVFSDRQYLRRHRQDRVLKSILRKQDNWYDPTLVKLLFNCVGAHPVGSLVRLDDGRRALVVRPNVYNLDRPKVWLFEEKEEPTTLSDGQAQGEEPSPKILDLMELDEAGVRYKHFIREGLHPEPGLDLRGLLIKKADYLLSYSL
ncbi:MAG: HD domain-containing protein [Elusimicrobia bacterium]|nr:HD domain-containing protein [Elusimicrobiota bacterium]